MSIRRTTKARRGMTAVAITTGLVLTVAACGGGDDEGAGDKKPSPSSGQDKNGDDSQSSGSDDGQILAEVKGGDDITLTIESAKREKGGFVTVTGQVANGGSKPWTGIEWKSDETELAIKNRASMAAAKLVDQSGKKRYFILRDTEGRCLCTSFQGALQPGDSQSWYAQFPAPPEDSNSVDFQIADMPPASIEIAGGE